MRTEGIMNLSEEINNLDILHNPKQKLNKLLTYSYIININFNIPISFFEIFNPIHTLQESYSSVLCNQYIDKIYMVQLKYIAKLQ